MWEYLVGNPGWWTLLAFLLYVAWNKRDAIFGLFVRRVEVAEQREEKQENERWTLTEKLITTHEKQIMAMQRLYEQEWNARRGSDERAIESAKLQQQAAMQSLEIMQDFADIARLMVTRQDAHDERLLAVMESSVETNTAVGFVLTQLYFADKGRTFRDLVVEMKREQTVEEVRTNGGNTV